MESGQGHRPKFQPRPQRPYGGIVRRLLAYVIDIVPITLAVFAVAWFAFGLDEVWSTRNDPEGRIAFLEYRRNARLIATLVWILYGTAFEASSLRATPGKLAVGLTVVDDRGAPVDRTGALLRNSAKYICGLAFGLGYLWILFSKQRAGWHDLLAKTRVVRA